MAINVKAVSVKRLQMQGRNHRLTARISTGSDKPAVVSVKGNVGFPGLVTVYARPTNNVYTGKYPKSPANAQKGVLLELAFAKKVRAGARAMSFFVAQEGLERAVAVE